jgi:hypothetical protein
MMTELSFAVIGGVKQIRREDDNHMVIINSEGSGVLKNG